MSCCDPAVYPPLVDIGACDDGLDLFSEIVLQPALRLPPASSTPGRAGAIMLIRFNDLAIVQLDKLETRAERQMNEV